MNMDATMILCSGAGALPPLHSPMRIAIPIPIPRSTTSLFLFECSSDGAEFWLNETNQY